MPVATVADMRTTPLRSRPLTTLFTAGAFIAMMTSCGGGGGSDLVGEAAEHADATCECTEFDCTTEHIQWFNKVSISQEDDLADLSEADRATYLEHSLRAADCQDALR